MIRNPINQIPTEELSCEEIRFIIGVNNRETAELIADNASDYAIKHSKQIVALFEEILREKEKKTRLINEIQDN